MAFNTYQLRTQAPVGAYVTLPGPYDRYGRVAALQPSGFHLIRGLGNETPVGVRTFYSVQVAAWTPE